MTLFAVIIPVVDDFVSVPVADALMDAFERAEPSFYQLRGRRCLPIGGRVTTAGLIPADYIPPWMNSLFDHVFEHVLGPVGLPRPNHALVNVYEPGEGIMAHEDGPAYTPYATILSLGSSSVFDFVEKSTERRSVARVYLPVGSLLLFRDSAYTDVLHEFRHDSHDRLCEDVLNHPIDGVEERLGRSRLASPNLLARGKRISITMRHVCLASRN